MKDMAKNTTAAANRGQTRKPATRKQEQPPTGATAGMKPEHQTGATDRNTTKNRTIAAADRDHAADPVSIQGKPKTGAIIAALTEYSPDTFFSECSRMKLTADQRGEIMTTARIYSGNKPRVMNYCTPNNAAWIFAAIDKVISELKEIQDNVFDYPELIYPFMLSLEFPAASMLSPLAFLESLRSRMNAFILADPDLLETVTEAILFQESFGHATLAEIKAEAIHDAADAISSIQLSDPLE